MNLLKNVLSGWIGLNNTVNSFDIGKEYKYKCNNNCKKPYNVDDVLENMNYRELSKKNANDMEIIKQNAYLDKLYSHDNIKSNDVKNALDAISSTSNNMHDVICRLYYSSSKQNYEYVPTNCVYKLEHNSPILNYLNNKTYTFLESVGTPVTGKTPTFIFKDNDANMIFVIFGFGYVPDNIIDENENFINKKEIICFISNTLLKYLHEDTMIVLCGHSSGIVNAFLVGEELYHSVIDNTYNLSTVQKIKRLYDKKIDDYEDDLKKIEEYLKDEYDMYHELMIKDQIQFDKFAKSFEIEINKIEDKEKLIKLISEINDYSEFYELYSYIYPRYIDGEYIPKKPIGYEESVFKKIHTFLNGYENQQEILNLIYLINKKKEMNIYYSKEADKYKLNGMEYKKKIDEFEKAHNINILTYDNLKKYRNFINKKLDSNRLHNKIFICGSGGYPCFGKNTLDYESMKKFYHNRILHFRLTKDYFLEKNLDKTLNLYRTDLIELRNNDLIFHTSLNLIDEQKKTNYSQLSNMSKPEIFMNHDWSNYLDALKKMYSSEKLLNEILINYNITNNTIIGGSYHDKYIKYKMKYVELKSTI